MIAFQPISAQCCTLYKTSPLLCLVKQMAGFYMKRNTKLKWVSLHYLSLTKFFVTCIGNHRRAHSISQKYLKKITCSMQSESDGQILKERESLREDWQRYQTSVASSEAWENHGKKMALNM